ncbi:hypothetical protein E4U41_003477 [Claviceps citrina]|nr:hypothetical protein E4U41_003477 [Claviceps citrina]
MAADKTPEPVVDVADVAAPVVAADGAPDAADALAAAAAAAAPAPAPAPAAEAKSSDETKTEGEEAATTVETASKEVETLDGAAAEAADEDAEPKEDTNNNNTNNTTTNNDNTNNAAEADVDTMDAADTTTVDADAPTVAVVETPSAKNKGGRRKSVGGGLSRKGSKARLTHTDAKPGDHFLVKLKGFPAWPAIICDEDMLPHALVTSRPVSAARPDGTYGEAFADGGKRVNDRTFPVMYLHTNEFGWEKNTNLSELSADKARDSINDKMRKDLKAAFELAVEQHPVQYYKDILQSFQDELVAQEEARREAAATPKKGKKNKSKAAEDEDTEMLDADASAKKPKKRKADDEAATPQRADSVKKPKIKLTLSSTPKSTNGAAAGAATPKSAGASSAKVTKIKTKKTKEAKATAKEATEKKAEAAEAKLSPEARHKRKVKEVLFLRHKLQKGLLTREQKPKEEEMQSMSDFITLLEKFGNLEVSIIRETKINKVLKAILKLDAVPREEEFQFKKRSQTLLDKWNKLLAGDASTANANANTNTNTNGVNGSDAAHGDGNKTEEAKEDKEADGVKADGESKSLEPGAEAKAEGADEAAVVTATE